ncbi:Sin3 associated polypeptide p18-domain-containing protein [Bisporella sp. PMI_857]|nr:Sin3 associated polypeptide p18-domain-containing protein [Bisporella sp. PMI_857]
MATAPVKIDRQQHTPFLLKLFYKTGGYHSVSDFSPPAELPPFIQIYTWPTCTLRELAHLLTTALPSLLPEPAIGTRLAFRLIFADTRSSAPTQGPGRYSSREIGSVVLGDGGPGILPDEEEAAIVAGGRMTGSLMGEPEKTLQEVKFVVGDYVTCSILPAQANGHVAPLPSGPRDSGFGSRGRGGSRVGGYGQGIGAGVPNGEWRRGERVPEGPSGGRGRGYGGGFGGGGRGSRW